MVSFEEMKSEAPVALHQSGRVVGVSDREGDSYFASNSVTGKFAQGESREEAIRLVFPEDFPINEEVKDVLYSLKTGQRAATVGQLIDIDDIQWRVDYADDPTKEHQRLTVVRNR